MSIDDKIKTWIDLPAETPNLEFKAAKRRFNKRNLCRYCVALANEGGGKLVLGITDEPPRQIVGTTAFRSIQKTVRQVREKVHMHVSCSEHTIDGARLLIFEIPPRPTGTAYQYEGCYLMRSGSSLTTMTEDRLRAIFDEGKPNWLLQFAKTDCADADVIDLLDTQTFFDLMNMSYPSSRDGVLARLEAMRFIHRDGFHWAITNLGAISFAKALADFELISTKTPRVVVYDGVGKLQTRRDVTGNAGYATGFKGLVDYVMALLPSNEVIEGAIRKSVPMIPPTIVRELVANALVHQDFGLIGTRVIIEIYANRLEVHSPGAPIVPVDRFIDGSRSRNSDLTDLMRRLGICEELGSGIDKVIEQAEIFQLPAPEFRGDDNSTRVIVAGPQPLGRMGKEDRVRACYQHCALKYVFSERMTNGTLRDRFRLSSAKSETATRIIKDTVDAGMVRLEDPESTSRRYTKYVPYWA